MHTVPSPAQIAHRLLPAAREPGREGTAFASANIALCKYWGKRDEALKLPLTGSLSISMGTLGTRMTVRPAAADCLQMQGEVFAADHKVARRLFGFLDLLRPPGLCLEVESENTIPMGAGLASSASAFAAAVRAMEALFGWDLPPRSRSMLARLGSGSACRSLERGFVEWLPGEAADGMDSYGVGIAPPWPELRVGVLTLSGAEKPVGSTEGMRRTVETSRLFDAWPAQVARDLPRIRAAVLAGDFHALGAAAEQNALSMHATMMAAWPPILYWRPETVAALHRVHALRAAGLPVYATLDAGPNVKLLFPVSARADLLAAFPDLLIATP